MMMIDLFTTELHNDMLLIPTMALNNDSVLNVTYKAADGEESLK